MPLWFHSILEQVLKCSWLTDSKDVATQLSSLFLQMPDLDMHV